MTPQGKKDADTPVPRILDTCNKNFPSYKYEQTRPINNKNPKYENMGIMYTPHARPLFSHNNVWQPLQLPFCFPPKGSTDFLMAV